VLLLEHAAWSLQLRHALLATEWCRQELLHDSCSGAGRAAAGAFLDGELEAAGGGGTARRAVLEEHGARLKAAWVLAGVGEELPQPRAKY
jgi:hypothetical protein